MHFRNGKVIQGSYSPIIQTDDKEPEEPSECKVYRLNADQLKKLREGKEVDTSEQEVKTIDIYFENGSKKKFENITEIDTFKGWMKLTKTDGKDILINSQNVNFVDEV